MSVYVIRAYVKTWEQIGVLQETQAGKEKLFVHPKLLYLMTADENNFTPYQSIS